MDDLVSSCQHKLSTFRIKELKDVLSRIGIARQGKKQVLLDRIMAVLSPADQGGFKSNGGGGNQLTVGREKVAKIIDDIFRKMKGSGALDLASKDLNAPKTQFVHEDEVEEPSVPEAKTRCPCGSSMDHDTMIQCDDSKCGVWQHLACVVIPEKAVEGVQADVPSQFYCEVCRVNRADPFCVLVGQPLLPTKLITSIITGEGSSPLQNVERTFVLTKADRDLLQRPGYDLQVWCILLNDTVLFRMHWPQYADLRINGIAVRVTNRPAPQLLGANGRDDSAGIVACIREGTNRISLSAYDARQFCLGVRIIRRLSVQQVLRLVPNQTEGEPFEEALGRVRRCIGGGTSLGNTEDNDSDLEVVADSVVVNLRCPMSGSRITVAGRFKPCEHMGCFDLQTFIELNERTRKWQCPICLGNYSLQNIIIDPYFSRIASAIKSYPEEVTEVEVKPDGSWRPKLGGEARFHEKWHFPDGSICITNGDDNRKYQHSKQVKQEDDIFEGRMTFKIGIKRNRDGHWEVNGTKDMHPYGANNVSQKNEKRKTKIMRKCSSATASNGDHEDPSVNQEASENLDISMDNDVEFDSASLGLVHASSIIKPINGQLLKESEVIVLSDSDEDDLNIGSSTASAFAGSDNLCQGGLARLNSSETLPEAHISRNGIPYIPDSSSRLPVSFSEVNSVPHNANTPLDLFGINAGEFNPPPWLAESQNAAFQLFETDPDVPDATVNSQHASVIRPAPINKYTIAPQQQTNRLPGARVSDYPYSLDSRLSYVNAEVDGDANENSRGVGNNNASLQLFPPPQPARASFEDDTSEPVITSDILQTNWISLSLGSGNTVGTHSQETAVAVHGKQQSANARGRLDSLANTALNMSNDGIQVASADNRGSESPTLCHQRQRSVRPRFYLPVDSESE
eukprot:Gb_29862 [translate_table: standard]